jgi:4-hydroxy-tetrahydrodipicolinate reductase
MGRRIIEAVLANQALELVGAVERPDCPELGQDLGPLMGGPPKGLSLSGHLAQAASKAKTKARLYIDFTTPEAVMDNLAQAQDLGLAAVIGTTGLDQAQKKSLSQAAEKMPILWSPNMSLGVNLMLKVAQTMAQSLGPAYDIEIIEAHHRLKKDAPSGTALKLHELVAQARNLDPAASMITGRTGLVGARSDKEIGVLAVRGGDIVGDHTVLFAGPGERLELTHRAHSRETFVSGTLRAIFWLDGQKPGLYSLSDLLDL